MPENNNNWPSGTITFLFTDIEKSTLLWERYGEQMRPVQARHDALLRTAVEQHGGRVVKTTGDGLHAAFETAASALAAATSAQRQLQSEAWFEIAPDQLRVRMGLHSGEAQWRDGDYYGAAVNRAARIMGLGHGGQILLAAVTAGLLQEALPPNTTLRDMGSHPLRGLQREEHIYQLAAPDLLSDFPPLNAGRLPAGNLPAHVSSFIGRTREMAEIRSVLPRTRLLTLTGPGGTGKTRLSLQLASDVQAAYLHGAWLVELAPVTDPELVVKTVAGAFNLQGLTDTQTREILFDYLREKQLLLILDNCEHLITACAQLADDLIASCPRLTILASSREGLGVYGETTYHLPTLSLPAVNCDTAEIANRSEAVQLFLERAAAAQPGFRVSDANAPAVAQIVRRLDGIPLAIELAAARLKVFSVEQIAARLDQRFRLLTGGSRTALPRQQTLRALIDWSYDLLDEDERDLFRRLSVFLGGWTFEAAESVALSLDVYTLLPQLVGKSLVMREVEAMPESWADNEPPPEPRFSYLETIRQYARDRLIESGMVEEARDRHFAYYEALSQSVEYDAVPNAFALKGNHLLLEQDNLRAAVEWSSGRYPERTLDLLWNLLPFISDQLPGSESIDWTSLALQRLDSLPPVTGVAAKQRERLRHTGLVMIGLLKMFTGQLDEAWRLSGEVSELLQDNDGDPVLLANALFTKAQTGYYLEDPARDETLAQAEVVLRSMADHPSKEWMLAMVLMLSAEIESRNGNMELVERHYQESKLILENATSAFLPWLEYSRLEVLLGMNLEPDAARELYQKAIRALRYGRSGRMAAMAESGWAHRMRHEGNFDEAMAIYQRMMVEWRELGHRAAMANIMENIAFIDRIQGRPERAVRLLGAAERLREVIGQDMLRLEREEYERELGELKRSLNSQEVDRLWTEGRALSTDAVIDLTLRDDKLG